MKPRAIAWLLAALITFPLADSVFQIPIQVSDSLEPIVISAKYATTSQLLQDSVRFSPTTFRPMRYLQARWLLGVAEAGGLTYNTVFRGVHVLLLVLLVWLFVLAADVRTWVDLAAFSVAFPVFIGIHTFVAMLQEAFPVNHYAEVGICVLAVLALAQRPPRPYVAPVICALLAFALSVIESGAIVWVTVIGCAVVRMRGITRATVMSTTVLIAAYLVMRHALDIATPGIGGHGSGFGATFYSAEELVQRFGDHPAGFMAYNVAGGLASLLFSEPRQGVYSLALAWRDGVVHPILAINLVSSVATTALLVWYGVTHLRGGGTAWSDRNRLFVAVCGVMIANAALTVAYIKDEIISPGGLCYAIAVFIAVAALVESLPRRGPAVASIIALLLATTAALWMFRAAGVHYVLRYDAFRVRNDWVEVLREDKPGDWPTDPRALALTRRIRDEAILRRGASPSFMPRWADRVLGRMKLLTAALMLPCLALAALSGWWTIGPPLGAGLWPPDEVTLSEAVATRNNAEALRLIRLGADPNQPSRVRAGLLTSDYAVDVTPVEAAVGAQRADAVRMLLANGAKIDGNEMRVLRCYEQIRRDSAVRGLLGDPPDVDCAGVRLPVDRNTK